MNLRSQPLVSIVTPVYNGERYLAECVESVLAQTYQNWEYVVVNNLSTDRTSEIARCYAEKDGRIRIHNNQEFFSIIQNWNHALEQMSPQSRYCKVLHADDWLFPECLERMVSVAEENSEVGLVASYRLISTKLGSSGLPYSKTAFSGREIARTSLRDRGALAVFGTPTSTLIRGDLIRQQKPFYDESFYHADAEVCYRLLRDHDFGFVHQVLTFTRTHSDSETTNVSTRYYTEMVDHLGIFQKHGAAYFSPDECRTILREKESKYYRFLARKFARCDRDLLNYQKKALKQLGLQFSWRKLVLAGTLEFFDLLLEPKVLARRLSRVIKSWRKRDSSHARVRTAKKTNSFRVPTET